MHLCYQHYHLCACLLEALTTASCALLHHNCAQLCSQVRFLQSAISRIETFYAHSRKPIEFEPDVFAWDESAISALALARQSNTVSARSTPHATMSLLPRDTPMNNFSLLFLGGSTIIASDVYQESDFWSELEDLKKEAAERLAFVTTPKAKKLAKLPQLPCKVCHELFYRYLDEGAGDCSVCGQMVCRDCIQSCGSCGGLLCDISYDWGGPIRCFSYCTACDGVNHRECLREPDCTGCGIRHPDDKFCDKCQHHRCKGNVKERWYIVSE